MAACRPALVCAWIALVSWTAAADIHGVNDTETDGPGMIGLLVENGPYNLENWSGLLSNANATGSFPASGFNVSAPYPASPIDGWEWTVSVRGDIPLEGAAASSGVKDSKYVTGMSISLTPPVDLARVGPNGPEINVDPSWRMCAFFLTELTPSANGKLQTDDGTCSSALSQECIQEIEDATSLAQAVPGECRCPQFSQTCLNSSGLVTSPSCTSTLVARTALGWQISTSGVSERSVSAPLRAHITSSKSKNDDHDTFTHYDILKFTDEDIEKLLAAWDSISTNRVSKSGRIWHGLKRRWRQGIGAFEPILYCLIDNLNGKRCAKNREEDARRLIEEFPGLVVMAKSFQAKKQSELNIGISKRDDTATATSPSIRTLELDSQKIAALEQISLLTATDVPHGKGNLTAYDAAVRRVWPIVVAWAYDGNVTGNSVVPQSRMSCLRATNITEGSRVPSGARGTSSSLGFMLAMVVFATVLSY